GLLARPGHRSAWPSDATAKGDRGYGGPNLGAAGWCAPRFLPAPVAVVPDVRWLPPDRLPGGRSGGVHRTLQPGAARLARLRVDRRSVRVRGLVRHLLRPRQPRGARERGRSGLHTSRLDRWCWPGVRLDSAGTPVRVDGGGNPASLLD